MGNQTGVRRGRSPRVARTSAWDPPVVLDYRDVLIVGIGLRESVIHGANLGAPDDIGGQAGDLAGERVQGANEAPLLLVGALALGQQRVRGPLACRNRPTIETHLIQEGQYYLLRSGRGLRQHGQQLLNLRLVLRVGAEILDPRRVQLQPTAAQYAPDPTQAIPGQPGHFRPDRQQASPIGRRPHVCHPRHRPWALPQALHQARLAGLVEAASCGFYPVNGRSIHPDPRRHSSPAIDRSYPGPASLTTLSRLPHARSPHPPPLRATRSARARTAADRDPACPSVRPVVQHSTRFSVVGLPAFLSRLAPACCWPYPSPYGSRLSTLIKVRRAKGGSRCQTDLAGG